MMPKYNFNFGYPRSTLNGARKPKIIIENIDDSDSYEENDYSDEAPIHPNISHKSNFSVNKYGKKFYNFKSNRSTINGGNKASVIQGIKKEIKVDNYYDQSKNTACNSSSIIVPRHTRIQDRGIIKQQPSTAQKLLMSKYKVPSQEKHQFGKESSRFVKDRGIIKQPKTVQKLSNDIMNVTNEMKILKEELGSLRRAKYSDPYLCSFSAFGNGSNIPNRGIATFKESLDMEEESARVIVEVEELEEKILDIRDELNRVKSSEKRKLRESLLKEVENLEKSCEDVDNLRKKRNSKYKKMKEFLLKRNMELQLKPDCATNEIEFYRWSVPYHKRILKSYEPKPPPPPKPKPEPYKTPDHLDLHRRYKIRIEIYEKSRAKLKEPIMDYKGVGDKINVCLSNQERRKYALKKVKESLQKKLDDVKSAKLPPVDDRSQYNKEIEEFCKMTLEEAEKEYEANAARRRAGYKPPSLEVLSKLIKSRMLVGPRRPRCATYLDEFIKPEPPVVPQNDYSKPPAEYLPGPTELIINQENYKVLNYNKALMTGFFYD